MSIPVKLDTTECMALIRELSATELPQKVAQLLLGILQAPAEFCRIESGPTTRAGITLLLKPSNRLRDFAAAVRAGDFQRLVVE